MKCWAIYGYGKDSCCADEVFGVYFNKDKALEAFGDGKFTYGDGELKEFEVTEDLTIEELA